MICNSKDELPLAHSTTESILKHSRDRFINRELSWLKFNERVLSEAMDESNPLLERVNFLAISASNLDEFVMVRVAGLIDQIVEGDTTPAEDGLSAHEQLELIHANILALINQQNNAWHALSHLLKEEGISIVQAEELKHKDIAWLSEHFLENIFPVLTPIAIDPAHPFPFLPNLSMAWVFQLQAADQKTEHVAIVPLPASLPRFVRLPAKTKARFVAMEDIITFFIDALFPGFQLMDKALFRVTRDSELDIEREGKDFMRGLERAVQERRRGRVIRLRFANPAPKHLLQFVSQQMQMEVTQAMELDGMLSMRHLRELHDLDYEALKFTPFKARFPERITDFGGDCFAAIAAKDIVIHHPFESFDVVLQFVRQAAADPNVVSIKQTLYRTSNDSPIVKALIEAAEAGKAVTALVELKARFDEEANLKWARDLERAGVHVVYGFVELKTHAKVVLVTRREAGALKSYVHFGTGNYHPNTARAYTDLSFFTCDQQMCRDAAYLFNFVTGYAPPRNFRKLVVAPRYLRKRIRQLIAEEIEHAKAGRPAGIWAKMNALVDTDTIDALYEASCAGVRVELVVRGICCLKPGVPGLSENIRVKSIVGRFLEHSRIYCFGAGHEMPSPHAKVFIGSADWMPRNFDWRVEVMVPIENPTVHEQILTQIMLANLKDEKNSWVMQPDGDYLQLSQHKDSFSSHDYFIQNPSLSGRGKALKQLKSKQMQKYKPLHKTGHS